MPGYWPEIPSTVNKTQEESQIASTLSQPNICMLDLYPFVPFFAFTDGCRLDSARKARQSNSSPITLPEVHALAHATEEATVLFSTALKNYFLALFRASRVYCHPLRLHLNHLSSECPPALFFKQWCPSFLIIQVM